MLQNKQSRGNSLYSVMSHVTKILQKKLYCEFKRPLQCNRENTGQNFAPEITEGKGLPLHQKMVARLSHLFR